MGDLGTCGIGTCGRSRYMWEVLVHVGDLGACGRSRYMWEI